MALAIKTLSDVEEASAYAGPTGIHLADPHILELLQLRYVRAKLYTTAVGRIHNRILYALPPKISFKAEATHHRTSKGREWGNPAVGMWVAHHVVELTEASLPRGTLLQGGPAPSDTSSRLLLHRLPSPRGNGLQTTRCTCLCMT